MVPVSKADDIIDVTRDGRVGHKSDNVTVAKKIAGPATHINAKPGM